MAYAEKVEKVGYSTTAWVCQEAGLPWGGGLSQNVKALQSHAVL